jgi:glycosyltransferase involved in cell wall biosynthesis
LPDLRAGRYLEQNLGSRRVSHPIESVSVVIPTRNRPGLVGRAVRSALSQVGCALEVVVVIDGPDEATARALAEIADERVRVVELPASGGAQEARNRGIEAARGAWVAFLDDDDEWLPSKLERQLAAAQTSRFARPIVSCGLVHRSAAGDTTWPKRPPRDDEPIHEYLFMRRHDELAEIRLQTSTLLAPRELLLSVPWRKGAHDEWDLLLRAAAEPGVGLAFVDEPLVIWHFDAGPDRLSMTLGSWRRSEEWFRSVRTLVGRRAYASFLLSTLSIWARDHRDWKAFVELPWEAIRRGEPTAAALATHAGRWLVPKNVRNNLRSVLRRVRGA